jgi:prepilin-type N-terminal cleavage/methylation domain-containing protein
VRLKGFTLIEIIFAMILSGILLALAIKVILTMTSVSTLQNSISSQNNNLLSVYTLLKVNFLKSSSIETNGQSEIIFNYSNRPSINVSFQPSKIIVSNNISFDTIKVPWESLHIEKLDSVSRLINQLSFEIKYNSTIYPLFIRKAYSNQTLFNLE